MTSTYTMVEIQDALAKIKLYLQALQTSNNPQRCQKAAFLATEVFLKFQQNQEFAKESQYKVRALINSKNNYYAFLLWDQMVKNNKNAFKMGKQYGENLFKGVWEKTWSENNTSPKLQSLKLIVKVWGYIFSFKHEEAIKKWIQSTFKIKFTISPEMEKELKQVYGVPQQPKSDPRMDELLQNMKDEKQQNNLLEALMFDQD